MNEWLRKRALRWLYPAHAGCQPGNINNQMRAMMAEIRAGIAPMPPL